MTGYTKRQADTLNRQIAVQTGRACDAIARMAELVPDHRAPEVSGIQQLVLELEDELQRIVNRRRRPDVAPWQDPTGRI